MKVKEREGRQTVGIEVLLLHFVGDTLGNIQLLRCVVEDGRSVFCLKGERDRKGDKTSERTSANILALLVHRRGIVGAIEELCIMPDQNYDEQSTSTPRPRKYLHEHAPTRSSYDKTLGSNSMRTASAWFVLPLQTVL